MVFYCFGSAIILGAYKCGHFGYLLVIVEGSGLSTDCITAGFS